MTNKSICPICGKRETHLDWWSCASCARRLSPQEYNDLLLKIFNNKNYGKNINSDNPSRDCHSGNS